MPEPDYTVYDPTPLTFTHDVFFVETTPEIANFDLCGEIVYEGKYIDTVVPVTGGDPLSYDPSTRQFVVDTDNLDLVGTAQVYKVGASFGNYSPDVYADVSSIEV